MLKLLKEKVAGLEMSDSFDTDICYEKTTIIKCVVRLTRSYWHNNSMLCQKIELRYLKRKCINFNILAEDASNIGAEEVMPRIINLDECEDGIYEVVPCNESTDFETGYIDDYDYKLIPVNLTPVK